MPNDAGVNRAPPVSVVIPTIGRASLAGLIDDLAGDPALHETIIVDDRPHGAELLPAPGPGTIVVHSGGRGPGAARQLGAQHCTSEIVLLLDDDVRAPPELATGHARRHAGESGIVVIGQMPLTAPRTPAPAQELYRDDYARWSTRARTVPGFALERLWGGHFSVRRSGGRAPSGPA
jgi:glycosyltransferase involved in cell wall biosynthesis